MKKTRLWSLAKRRWFDNRSARLVGATAAGVEALLEQRQSGTEPHAQASRELVDQIRRELAQVARIVLGPSATASPWSSNQARNELCASPASRCWFSQL